MVSLEYILRSQFSNVKNLRIFFITYPFFAQLKDNVIVYKCVLRRVQQCKAKIIVKGSELVRENNSHTHAPDQANIAALLALQKMKSRARESLETMQQIISKEFECSDQGVASNLPTIRHLKKI